MSRTPIGADLLTWILGRIEDDVVVLDRDGIILYTNRVWRGYDVEDAVGIPLERILAPEFRDDHRRRMQRLFRTGKTETFEVKLERPDGAPVWYRGQLALVDPDDSAPLAVGISRNVTAERHGEEAQKLLQALLPVCSWCRRIRGETGEWTHIEQHLERSAGSSVTHGICPQCETKILHDDEAAV